MIDIPRLYQSFYRIFMIDRSLIYRSFGVTDYAAYEPRVARSIP
ncbi:hypothetical protein SXCC_04886 [Gluconacetobacter sp. SXCC-1]|nr:hypothetical protein SXCC_04886 [Gluconacetobacter sp. SXCC-1]